MLTVENLTVEFSGRAAIKDISLTFEPGKIYGLVGHNGSGKSTLIKTIAGFNRGNSGSVLVDDVSLLHGHPHLAYEQGIRFVHQELGLISQFTSVENFGLGAGFSRHQKISIDWNEQRERLISAMSTMTSNIEFDLDRPVEYLSAVDRTMLSIAMAVAASVEGWPVKYLLLDEPTTALESEETEQLFKLLTALRETRIGIVFVSHHIDEILKICSNVIVLRNGQVVTTFDHRTQLAKEDIIAAMLGADYNEVFLKRTPITSSVNNTIRSVGENLERQEANISKQQALLSISGLRSNRIHGINVEIKEGECVAVVGLSGSGREELVYAISGAIANVEIENIIFEGNKIKSLNPQKCLELKIGLVPGNRLPGSIVLDFSIEENITFTSMQNIVNKRTMLLSKQRSKCVAQKWIDRFNIEPNNPRFVSRYMSGGNKQKAILAKWLNNDPKLLLVDEPVAGVDVGAIASIVDTLNSVKAQGIGLLITTAEISEIIEVADRVIVLYRGNIQGIYNVAGDHGYLENQINQAMNGADHVTSTMVLP